MKARKGWAVIWADGTTWYGDCPRWAQAARDSGQAGLRVVPMRIYGAGRWDCVDCVLGLHH